MAIKAVSILWDNQLCCVVLMSCWRAIRAWTHVGFIVENVLLVNEDCWSQLFVLRVWQKQTFNIVHFYIGYVIVYALDSCKGFWEVTTSYFKETYRLLTLGKLTGHPAIFGIAPNWEQAPFILLLYIKAALGYFPLYKSHIAAPDIICVSKHMKGSTVTD